MREGKGKREWGRKLSGMEGGNKRKREREGRERRQGEQVHSK